MMRNLVWTFWLALIVSIVGTFVISALLMKQWNSFISYSQVEGRPNYPLQALAKEVEAELNKNGNLETLLLNNSLTEFGDVYLINSAGADVLGRTLPKQITILGSSLDVIHVKRQSATKPPILSLPIRSDRGKFYSMVFHFDSPTHPIWILFKKFGLYWVSVAALIISGLISWWLAAKIARPIQSLALASGLQGEGDFSTAIDERIRQRPDEIGALAQQLHTSGIKIQNLLKKQKDFLRDVSHEVRTPLARLQVAAETLELDARDERALNQIKHQVLVIDQLVQNLLHLSHFDRPSQSHNIESIPLRNLVYRCVENAQMVASLKNISLIIQDIDWQGLSVTGVQFLLDRALDNLMDNAIRHSPEHGEITVSCVIGKEHCYLGICDQGDGVAEDSLEEIFEPFVRLDSSRNRQTGGFGLGLSLVKRIAESHNGSVIASNHAGGFTIKLIIPLETNTVKPIPNGFDNRA
ncbi:MAG TPA: hypothetical protein DDW59_12110 [Gammaproteobacteria bacterium]|nr:hypothetical protein [Gammaproteobacteria bacterium]